MPHPIPADLWAAMVRFFGLHENCAVEIHQHHWQVRKVVLKETVQTGETVVRVWRATETKEEAGDGEEARGR